jgi:hypothetical protein
MVGVYGGVCMVVYGGVWWCVYVVVCDRQSSGRAVHEPQQQQGLSGSALIVYSCMVRGAGYTLKLFMSLEGRVSSSTRTPILLNTMSSLKSRTF